METLSKSDFSSGQDFLGQSSRRVFIKGLGFVGVSLLLSTLGGCERLADQIRNRPVRRRLRTGSAEVDADIATYREAVRLMKALGEGNPRKWEAQAGIHGTAQGFTQCNHSNHFFDWHRAYLFYFEKICQQITGNARFGLPYWNWNQDPGIHAAYLDPASPLFSQRTRTSMAGHNAVSTEELDDIFQDTNFFTFLTQIRGTPHNTVHTYIDSILSRGDSPRDPIFWNHHCMVDYCWYKWNVELNRNNPNEQTWLQTQNGQFFDGNGNPATATALTTILMPILSYRYESSAIGSLPGEQAEASAAEHEQLETRLRRGADVRFRVRARTRIGERAAASPSRPLVLSTSVRASAFAGIIESDTASARIFVTVDQAEVPAVADFNVRVFVNLPNASVQTATSDPHFAGSFAFFGPATSSAHDAHGGGPADLPRFMVDVTATLQRLRESGAMSPDAPLSVQLVPTPYDARPTESEPQLVFGAVDLITTPIMVGAQPDEAR